MCFDKGERGKILEVVIGSHMRRGRDSRGDKELRKFWVGERDK